jgi:nucleolin
LHIFIIFSGCSIVHIVFLLLIGSTLAAKKESSSEDEDDSSEESSDYEPTKVERKEGSYQFLDVGNVLLILTSIN